MDDKKLNEASVKELWDEITRRREEEDRIPERTLLQHIANWKAVCAKTRVGGLLKVAFSCERIPGDQVVVNDELTRLNVIWLDAVMRTRDRRKPGERRIVHVRFRQVVPIVSTRAERLNEIWRLTEDAYRHEAAELLRVGTRRVAQTHRNGSTDTVVYPP